ncbi:MAG: hypothetical protein AAFO69_13370, partial [Bacteroidota bacterium]
VHAENVGKFVFATNLNDIQFKNENKAGFKTKFSAANPVYARLYLEKSIGNTLHGGEKSYKSILMYDLKINGKSIGHQKSFGMYKHLNPGDLTYYTEEISQTAQQNTWTSWRLALLPRKDDPELSYGNVNIAARSFALALISQPAGTHQIELEMYSRDFASDKRSKVLASGSFTIAVTEIDKRALAFSYAPPLPKDEWQDGNKEQVIAEVTKAFENQLRKKPILVGLYGNGWQEGTYRLNGIRYRKMAAWAVFDDTDGDGQVPITTFNWISDYGGGGWTKLRFDSHCLGCPDWDVEVAAVKALAGS